MVLEPSTSSGSLAVGTTAVYANPALLACVILNPGSAASTVTVYDNASAGSGTVLASLAGVANGASVALPLSIPIRAAKGITVVVAGTGATAVATFLPTF
jgi:hypothetical protein